MKKLFLLALVSVGIVFAVPASTFAASSASTMVSGTVRANSKPVANATVKVTCAAVSGTDTTDSTGGYLVSFLASNCPTGSKVTAMATSSGGAAGTNSGTANQIGGTKLNVAVVDVNVALPEMGAAVSAVAALSAGGAFLVIRRKQVGQN